MKPKIEHTSKAQLEVSKWKEKAYNLIKDMPLEKGIDFIQKQTRQLSEELKAKHEKIMESV